MRPAGSSALPMSPLLEEEGEGSARAPSERVRRGRLVAAVGAAAVVAGLLVAGAQHRQAAPHRLMASGCADVIQTARDTGDRLSRLGCVHFEDDFDAPNVIDLTGARTGHAILGFGGAFTEASALVWQALPADKREEFVRMYFDPDAGIGYTLGRVHINSCDFSLYSYSFDDVTDDWDLAFFDDDVSHDQRTMIPLILEAQRAARRPLHMLASPWSPPAWMKTSGHMDSSDKPGLRAECHDVWARYISRWISAYERLGVPIWGVTFQNEPENPAAWEACVYDAEQMVHWVGEHLGPVLRAQQPGVKIFSFDHNKDHLLHWANRSFTDPKASAYFDGVAFHWYSGSEFHHVKKVHDAWPDKMLLPSEATYERYLWAPNTMLQEGNWKFGEGYAHDILGDLVNGAAGWIDWNLLLDESGGPNHLNNKCDAAAMANSSARELYWHPQYYYMGHFSKFITPGSVHLRGSVTFEPPPPPPDEGNGTAPGPEDPTAWWWYGKCLDYGLQAGSFLRPDGLVATVVLNCGHDDIEYKLKDGDVALALTVPAHGIQTVLHARGAQPE